MNPLARAKRIADLGKACLEDVPNATRNQRHLLYRDAAARDADQMAEKLIEAERHLAWALGQVRGAWLGDVAEAAKAEARAFLATLHEDGDTK